MHEINLGTHDTRERFCRGGGEREKKMEFQGNFQLPVGNFGYTCVDLVAERQERSNHINTKARDEICSIAINRLWRRKIQNPIIHVPYGLAL